MSIEQWPVEARRAERDLIAQSVVRAARSLRARAPAVPENHLSPDWPLATLVHHLNSHFCSIRADLWDVHGVTQYRQCMECARTLSAHFVTQLPDTFR